MTQPDDVHPWPELIDALRTFVRRRVSDPHVAEDLIQDTLTKLAAALRTRPPAGPLHAWISRVAQNAIIDHYRARAKAPHADGVLEAVDDSAAATEREPLLASFRAFIHALPPEQREAVLQIEYEGVSQKELADRLGIPVSTVKSRVQRGRKRLRRALEDCCTFEFDRRGHIIDWHRNASSTCREC